MKDKILKKLNGFYGYDIPLDKMNLTQKRKFFVKRVLTPVVLSVIGTFAVYEFGHVPAEFRPYVIGILISAISTGFNERELLKK